MPFVNSANSKLADPCADSDIPADKVGNFIYLGESPGVQKI